MATQPNDQSQTLERNEQPLDGGFVSPLDEYSVKRTHAKTATYLAYILVCILGATVIVHYAAILVLGLHHQTDTVEALSRIFNVWLPVISSLVSSAVTYYFTKER